MFGVSSSTLADRTAAPHLSTPALRTTFYSDFEKAHHGPVPVSHDSAVRSPCLKAVSGSLRELVRPGCLERGGLQS